MSGIAHVGTGGVWVWWAQWSFLMVCSLSAWNRSLEPNLLVQHHLCSHLSVTHMLMHPQPHVSAVTCSHTRANAVGTTLQKTERLPHTVTPLPHSGRPVTFTQLNELSNRTIPQPLQYRGISILQHLILPVHSSPTPLMRAPGQAGL